MAVFFISTFTTSFPQSMALFGNEGHNLHLTLKIHLGTPKYLNNSALIDCPNFAPFRANFVTHTIVNWLDTPSALRGGT